MYEEGDIVEVIKTPRYINKDKCVGRILEVKESADGKHRLYYLKVPWSVIRKNHYNNIVVVEDKEISRKML